MTIGLHDLSQTMVGINRQLRGILQLKRYEVNYSGFSEGHDYLSWRGQMADVLIDLICAD